MTALPKRRLPSRADEAALSALRTRSPTIAGSTRWTNDGRAETSPGLSRRSGAEVGAPGTMAGVSRSVARVKVTTRFMEPLHSEAVLSFVVRAELAGLERADRKSTRLNSSHRTISYAVFCLKKK